VGIQIHPLRVSRLTRQHRANNITAFGKIHQLHDIPTRGYKLQLTLQEGLVTSREHLKRSKRPKPIHPLPSFGIPNQDSLLIQTVINLLNKRSNIRILITRQEQHYLYLGLFFHFLGDYALGMRVEVLVLFC